MTAPRIVLAGFGPKLDGLQWETEETIRIGRENNADVVIRDVSVERVHAEVKNCGSRWVVRDLANNDFFPTLVNGEKVKGGQRELRRADMIQLGKAVLRVAAVTVAVPPDDAPAIVRMPDGTPVLRPAQGPGDGVPTVDLGPQGAREAGARQGMSCTKLAVQATSRRSWEESLEIVAGNRESTQGRALFAVLQANQHLSSYFTLEQLLQSILADALDALGAQRGAIFLADIKSDELELRAMSAPRGTQIDKGYSKTLVERCFTRGESLLSQDTESEQALLDGRRIKLAGMTSVVCAFLRTPQKRLGVLHVDRGPLQDAFSESDLHLADAFAASVSLGIECARGMESERGQFLETVSTLARAVDPRYQDATGHTRRVTDLALLLAEEMQVPQAERREIQLGASLYDIGNMDIDEAILRKPGKLTPAEFDAIKTHTVKGAALLESIKSLKRVVPIVRHHHERWDGTGYPDGLGREQIARTARIVAVADAFDAMTSVRPYRSAMPPQRAFLEILSRSGTHFDPICVQAFLRARTQIEGLLAQQKTTAAS